MALPVDYDAFLRGFGSGKFVELLPIQRAVLHEYATKFSTVRDVAAQMPTGTGKSLVALVIAEAWRHEGKKVAILSANQTLAHQMKEQEADALGVQTILMEVADSKSRPHPVDVPTED
jgi:superfamily II DNA or RNA helicase